MVFSFQAAKLQAKLSGEQAEPSKIQRLNSIPCQCDTNSSSSSSNSQTEQIVRDLLRDMVDDALNRVLQTSEPSNPASSGTSEPSYPAWCVRYLKTFILASIQNGHFNVLN